MTAPPQRALKSISFALLLAFTARASAQQTPSPVTYSATDGTIRFFQWKVAQDPDDFFNYDRLGVAYIQKARETGDIVYYDLADKSLSRALTLEHDSPDAAPSIKHLASVYFAEHRFTEAKELAERAIKLNGRDVTPYAILGDANSEFGEYGEAWAAYAHLEPAGGADSFDSSVQYLKLSREATRQLLEGDSAASIASLTAAVEVAKQASMPEEAIAWTQFMVGEGYFQTGDLTHSKSAYEDSLGTYPNYHRALAGLAKVNAAQGHLVEAADLYQKALAVIPYPAYAAALGDVYTKMGNTAKAKLQYDLVEYIGRLNVINKTVYNRELAVFYADHALHLPEALDLAKKEFAIRHDIYTYDALAWTLLKNGQPEAAADAITQALRLGTKDPILLFHAGMIYRSLEQKDKAKTYLAQALIINPHFHLLFSGQARQSLQQLSNIAQQPSLGSHAK